MLGDNGIIKKAQQARDMHANSVIEEQVAMNTLDAEYANMMYEPPQPPEITADTPAGTEVKMPNTWTSTAVKAISDGAGTEIPLPDGFYYVGGDYNSGLVISDKQGDTIDASGTSMGNQFVWIPVENDTTFIRESFESGTLDTTVYIEPLTSGGYSTEESEYNTMRSKVIQYGGFFIGRFEAGINDSTTPRAEGDEVEEVVVKKGVYPYNYVAWGDSMTSKGTEGAVYLAQHMYTGETQSSSVTSTLIYGVQWDAMCRYIGDYTRTTEPKNGPRLTGSVSTDVSKNIYDLAGNCYEWTMEANKSNYRVLRGGDNEYNEPVFFRTGDFPDSYYYDYFAFRIGLYIK